MALRSDLAQRRANDNDNAAVPGRRISNEHAESKHQDNSQENCRTLVESPTYQAA